MTGDEATGAWASTQWAIAADERAVEVEGARIAYRGWNLGAADLPGLVLVHGFRAHARWWDHIAPSLARSRRVAAIDLSGMGDSGRRARYSRALHGREILHVAADCGFRSFALVAHSYGATPAILAARATPEQVERLVVIDSALPLQGDAGHQIPVMPRRLYPSREAAVERFRLIPPGEWPVPAILAYIAHHAVRETAEGWQWKFDETAAATLNEERYRDALFGVTVPTDVIYGSETEVMTPERRAMAALIAPLCGPPIAIPAAHHHILVERPIALVATLDTLLARPAVRSSG